LGLATFNRQNPSICTNKLRQSKQASNQDILSQDIEEAVVIKKKNTTFKETAKEEVKPKPKENPQPSKAPLMHCQAS
jgi:hypothetical protein